MTAATLQLLRDAGGAGEEVEGGAAAGGGEERTDHVDEAPLGAQVLDRHERRRYPRIVATLRRRERRRRPEREPTQWWDGEVLYQIYPRSYQDSDGDGVGDLRGIIDRLDHLAWLGVRAIWLSPVTVSPNADFGYDVADYYDVDPSLGTLARPRRARRRGRRRAASACSWTWCRTTRAIEHPWFEASRSSRDNPKRDWYVWADPAPDGGPPNNWVSVFGGPALDARRHDRPVLPAQLPRRAARPQLVERGGARPVRPHPPVLVRRRRHGVPDRRRAHGDQGPRAARQPAGRRRRRRVVHGEDARAAPGVQLAAARGARRAPPWREVADSYDPPRLLVGETFVEHLDDLFPFTRRRPAAPRLQHPVRARAVRGRRAARHDRAHRGSDAATLHAGVDGEQPRHLAVPDPVGRGRSRPRAVRAR